MSIRSRFSGRAGRCLDLRAGEGISLTGRPSIFLPSGLSLMVRVPHHDPEHGRRVMVEDGKMSLSNRRRGQ